MDKYFRTYRFRISEILIAVNTIDEIEDILSFAETKDIIAWIKEDAELRDILYNPRELSTSTISLRWKTQNKDRTLTCSVPSYLHFVFSQEPWIQVGEWKYRIDACLLSSEKRDVIFESLVFPNVGEYVSDLGGKISKHKDEYTSVLKNYNMSF